MKTVTKVERERERESEERVAMETAICGRVPLSPNNVFNPTKLPGTLSLFLSVFCFDLINESFVVIYVSSL